MKSLCENKIKLVVVQMRESLIYAVGGGLFINWIKKILV